MPLSGAPMIWSASSERATPHTGKNDRILAAEEVADLGSQGNRQGPAHRPSNTLRSTTASLCCSSWAAYIRVSLPRRAIVRSSARPVRDSSRLTSAAPQPLGFHAASGDADRSAHGDATSR